MRMFDEELSNKGGGCASNRAPQEKTARKQNVMGMVSVAWQVPETLKALNRVVVNILTRGII